MRAGDSASSTSALRLRAGAPWSQAELQEASDPSLRAELLGPEVHADLEPVGHHRLDLERLVEGRAAHAHARVVVAGRSVRGRRHLEGVEAVGRLRPGVAAHELPARIDEVEPHRVVGREALRRVVEHERQVHRVAGPPDAALAVQEALQALRRASAADVEVRDRQRRARIETQVAGLPAVADGREEGGPRHRKPREAVAIGPAVRESLLLEVHERDVGAGNGVGAAQVVHDHRDLVVLADLGHQPEVRDQHVARRGDVVVVEALVVAGVAGVLAVLVALLPVARLVLRPAVPVALLLLVLVARPRLRELGRSRLVRARPGHVGPPERERQAIHAARALREQRLDVEPDLQPVVLLVGREVERQRLLPDHAADAPELLLAVEVVDLQELRHVRAGDLQRLDRHRAQVHGLDRHREAGRRRYDHALAGEAHRGLQLLEQHLELLRLLHAIAEDVAHAGLDAHRQLSLPALAAVDLHPAAVDDEAQVVSLGDAQQALQVLAGLERIGEAQLHVRLGSRHRARVGDREGVEARHAHVLAVLLLDADRGPVPADAHDRGRFGALDPRGAPRVHAAVGAVSPDDRQLAACVLCLEQLLDPGRVLDVGCQQPAGEGLALDVRGVRSLEPFDADVERLAHRPEHELEARERRLAGREERGEVEPGVVGLAVRQAILRTELDPVGRRPDRRAGDRRLEAEGRGRERRTHLLGPGERLVERDADRALARDRAAREGGDRGLLDLGELAALAWGAAAPAARRAARHRDGRGEEARERPEPMPMPPHIHPCLKAKPQAPSTRRAL